MAMAQPKVINAGSYAQAYVNFLTRSYSRGLSSPNITITIAITIINIIITDCKQSPRLNSLLPSVSLRLALFLPFHTRFRSHLEYVSSFSQFCLHVLLTICNIVYHLHSRVFCKPNPVIINTSPITQLTELNRNPHHVGRTFSLFNYNFVVTRICPLLLIRQT